MQISENNRKWWVLLGVSIASFLGCIDFTIVNTALPDIQTGLSASVMQLQWIINIFILALSTCMVIMGRLADIYGRRLVLYSGMIVFGFSSLGAGMAPTIHWLIFFRLIQGISCAILYTASGAIVSHAFPAKERGKAIGTLFGINGIGLAIGPVVGGFLVVLFSWRSIFLVNVPLILLSLIICFINVSESKNDAAKKTIDWFGLITLLVALPSLILAITQGAAWGWSSFMTIGAFALAFVMFIVFYLVETHAESPIIEFHLLANSTFIISVIATFALAVFYCLDFFLMPQYLHNIRNETAFMIGLMLLPATAMVALLSPLIGRLIDRYGVKLSLVVGFGCFIISALLQAYFSTETSTLFIIIAFAFMGIGWACVLGPSTVAVLSSVPENMSAVAMGSSWTFHNVGGAIGLGLGVVIFKFFAEKTLMVSLSLQHMPSGTWITAAAANPDRAIALLQQHTSLQNHEILTLFQRFFLNGYHAAMLFLIYSSLAALIIIIFGMKKIKQPI